MTRPWSRLLTGVVAVGVVALALAAALPHRHDAGSLSHAASACRTCKLQESAAATPPAPALAGDIPAPAQQARRFPSQSVSAHHVVRLPASRAPPASS